MRVPDIEFYVRTRESTFVETVEVRVPREFWDDSLERPNRRLQPSALGAKEKRHG